METKAILNRIFKATLLVVFVLTTTWSSGQTRIMSEAKRNSDKKGYDCTLIGLQDNAAMETDKKRKVKHTDSIEIPKEFYLPNPEPELEAYELEFLLEAKKVESERVPAVSSPSKTSGLSTNQ